MLQLIDSSVVGGRVGRLSDGTIVCSTGNGRVLYFISSSGASLLRTITVPTPNNKPIDTFSIDINDVIYIFGSDTGSFMMRGQPNADLTSYTWSSKIQIGGTSTNYSSNDSGAFIDGDKAVVVLLQKYDSYSFSYYYKSTYIKTGTMSTTTSADFVEGADWYSAPNSDTSPLPGGFGTFAISPTTRNILILYPNNELVPAAGQYPAIPVGTRVQEGTWDSSTKRYALGSYRSLSDHIDDYVISKSWCTYDADDRPVIAYCTDTSIIVKRKNASGTWDTLRTISAQITNGFLRLIAIGNDIHLFYSTTFLNHCVYTNDSGTWEDINELEGFSGFQACDIKYNSAYDGFDTLFRFSDGSFHVAYEFISLMRNALPNPPTHTKITSNGYTINRRPKFFFTVTDPDSGQTITDIEVQWDDVSDFSSVDATKRFGLEPAGWSGLPANSGSTITYSPNFDFANATWYMRVRAKDSENEWGPWSATQTFKIQSAPWSDTIPADATTFKADWMNQIATVTNAARQFRGLVATSFTDGTIIAGQTDIKAVHFSERQKAIQEALVTIGVNPTWSVEMNMLYTQGGGADVDWLKWSHYGNRTYWTSETTYSDATYGQVFQGVSAATAYLYDYYPYTYTNGQEYLISVWLKLNAGQTANGNMTAYLNNFNSGSQVTTGSLVKNLSLNDQWQYVEWIIKAIENTAGKGGFGINFGNVIVGKTLHAAKPMLRPFVDRSGSHVTEMRNYLLQI